VTGVWGFGARAWSDGGAPGLLPIHDALASRRFAVADRLCRKALRRNPADAEALALLGITQLLSGEAAAAVKTLRRVPLPHPQAQIHLAAALRQTGATGAAADTLQAALALIPPDAGLLTELAHLQAELERFSEAEASYRAALDLAPGNAVAARGLGNALAQQRRLAEARAAYRQAQAARPDWPSPLFHIGVLDLIEGDYAAGFRGYEHRLAEPALLADRIDRAAPAWRGEVALAGRTILLHDEQGFGDTLLFARYIPLLAARGARIVLELRPPLIGLFERHPDLAAIVPRGAMAPAHAYQCPLPSLPLACGTTLQTVPWSGPYLQPPAGLAAEWRARVGAGAPRVGLTWSTNRQPAYRSMPLDTVLRLIHPGAAFFAIQKDRSAAESALLAAHGVIDLSASLHDFGHTAAALSAMDLVITVDTAIANLAGALGRPTWVALPHLADWRWGEAGEGTPWYPTARLFRQEAPGDWLGVMARLRDEIARWLPSA
jgi:Flp pilus assembly protein TadD